MPRLASASASAILLLGLIGGGARAQPGKPLSVKDRTAVERCVGHMLMGPARDGIDIAGQGFNCKPVGTITAASGGYYQISGQLSHQLTARPDDQINYTIQFTQNGEVKDVRIDLDRGGFSSLPGKIFNAAGVSRMLPAFLKGPTSAVIDRVFNGLGADISNWQRSADLVIGSLAVEVARSQANRNTAGSVNYFVENTGVTVKKVEFTQGYIDRAAAAGSFPKDAIQRYELAALVNHCRKICSDAGASCIAWTLLRPVRGVSASQCSIKSAGRQSVLNRDAVSGMK